MKAVLRAAAALLLLVVPALADDTRPAYLGLTETSAGRFEVTFKVPRRGNRVLSIRPVLPPAFREVAPPVATFTPDAQVVRRTVVADRWELRGQRIGVEGLGAGLVDTLVRIQFADGSVVTRILSADRRSTAFPEPAAAGTAAAALDRTVLSGARHSLGLAHLVFLLGLAVATRRRGLIAALTAFAAAHAAGILLGPALGLRVPAATAEALLGIAGAVAAASAFEGGRGLAPLAAAVGLVHGAALAAGSSGSLGPLLLVTLGIDAAGLVLTAALLGLPRPRSVVYAVGAAGVFAALLALTAEPEAPRERGPSPLLATALAGGSSGGPASVPLAPRTDAPVRAFLNVEPFEIRLEAVVRVGDLEPGGEWIEPGEQEALAARIEGRFRKGTEVRVDGRPVSPALMRADFVTAGARGVLARVEPVREARAEALVGVVLSYLVERIPEDLSVRWGVFAGGAAVPATLVDPEATRTVEISPRRPDLTWKNELAVEPVPSIEAVTRRRPELDLSVLSLLVLVVAALAGLLLWRRGEAWTGFAAFRVLLAGAVLVSPYLTIPVPSPAESAPDAREARAILSALLGNVHRALDHPDESSAYDRLRVSVTGDVLERIYLENRRALLLARQGGARARVDSVEVSGVRDVTPEKGGGFRAEADWEAGGFVVHFGHRHFRRNRYRAVFTVVPDGDAWKIRAIDLAEKERVR